MLFGGIRNGERGAETRLCLPDLQVVYKTKKARGEFMNCAIYMTDTSFILMNDT